jgi:hypothetical protein
MRNKRTKIWIDRFQTKLSIRLAAYLILYEAALWALFWINNRLAIMSDSAGWTVSPFGTLLTPVIAFGLAVLFIRDAMRQTHRVVGPLYRFRKVIQAVTTGEDITLVRLRENDHLQELKADFNAMLLALEQRGAITLTHAAEQQPVGV